MQKQHTYNLIWKEEISKTWRVTRALCIRELAMGNGINIGYLFKTRTEATNYCRDNFTENGKLPLVLYYKRRCLDSSGDAKNPNFNFLDWDKYKGAK
jgi:hypothetical protein